MEKRLSLKFIGAAETVTGSASLIELGATKVLIDCGMFQGPKQIRRLNWQTYDKKFVESLDAVVLTHAHVDHSAMIPKLYQLGFRGPVYCTSETKELCRILLPDTAYLNQEEVRRKRSQNAESSLDLLYTVEEANESIKLMTVVERHQWIPLAQDLSFQLLRAGHILGSSIVQVAASSPNGVRILTFSGDLGNGRQRMIKGPELGLETDDLILESTYGDRVQSRTSPEDKLAKYVNQVVASGGVLLIPAFAVGRTQEVLFMLRQLEEEKRIPKLPVFLDSPMAIEATALYLQKSDDLKLKFESGEIKLPLAPSDFHGVAKMEDSLRLMSRTGPMIIISAAGMLTGGRILYHLKARLPDPNNILLFVGYQVEETKGRLLQSGLRCLRIHKEQVDVKASVKTIDSLSAHADSDDLIEWVKNLKKKPSRIFLNHGERSAQAALAYRLKYELEIDVIVPQAGQRFELFKS